MIFTDLTALYVFSGVSCVLEVVLISFLKYRAKQEAITDANRRFIERLEAERHAFQEKMLDAERGWTEPRVPRVKLTREEAIVYHLDRLEAGERIEEEPDFDNYYKPSEVVASGIDAETRERIGASQQSIRDRLRLIQELYISAEEKKAEIARLKSEAAKLSPVYKAPGDLFPVQHVPRPETDDQRRERAFHRRILDERKARVSDPLIVTPEESIWICGNDFFHTVDKYRSYSDPEPGEIGRIDNRRVIRKVVNQGRYDLPGTVIIR